MITRTRDLRAHKTEAVITWAHDRLDLTFEAIGEALGTSKRTILRWRSGEAAPRRKNEERLARLDEFRFWLLEVFGEDREAADDWLDTRIRDLGGKTPQEAIMGGDVERVIELLATYETGAFV